MSRIETLRRNYRRICGLPWDRNVAGPQRVWIAVYDKEDERKLRLRIGSFEESTRTTGHRWHRHDLTDVFADWLSRPDNAPFAESYFESPELLDDGPLGEFQEAVARGMIEAIQGLDAPDDTVFAVTGVASLFGFTRISKVLPLVVPHVRGRLLLFFPGVYRE